MAGPIVRREVGVVIFDRFEWLDVFGPLELYGALTGRFGITVIGPEASPIFSFGGRSSAGVGTA